MLDEHETLAEYQKSGVTGVTGVTTSNHAGFSVTPEEFSGVTGVTNPPISTPPPDPAAVREFYEERAAIFEYDADQPGAQAEAAALRRTLEHFHLPDPGAGGIAAVLAVLAARWAEPSSP